MTLSRPCWYFNEWYLNRVWKRIVSSFLWWVQQPGAWDTSWKVEVRILWALLYWRCYSTALVKPAPPTRELSVVWHLKLPWCKWGMSFLSLKTQIRSLKSLRISSKSNWITTCSLCHEYTYTSPILVSQKYIWEILIALALYLKVSLWNLLFSVHCVIVILLYGMRMILKGRCRLTLTNLTFPAFIF